MITAQDEYQAEEQAEVPEDLEDGSSPACGRPRDQDRTGPHAQQEDRHDSQGGAEEPKNGPADHRADETAVPVVGEEPGACGESSLFQGGGDAVEATWPGPQHRQQPDHFVGGGVAQR
jgi:hypothetical protein